MLTAPQKRAFKFLLRFTARNGYPPTAREVGKHLGSSNPGYGQQVLNALERKGWIKRGKRARQISSGAIRVEVDQKWKPET